MKGLILNKNIGNYLRRNAILLVFFHSIFGISEGFAIESIEIPKAEFKSRTEVTLDKGSALSEFYSANIEILNFSSKEEALDFFNLRTNNLVSYELDYERKIVIIKFFIEYADPSWSVNEWEKFLNEIFNL